MLAAGVRGLLCGCGGLRGLMPVPAGAVSVGFCGIAAGWFRLDWESVDEVGCICADLCAVAEPREA